MLLCKTVGKNVGEPIQALTQGMISDSRWNINMKTFF
jgi:hypothetical protein